MTGPRFLVDTTIVSDLVRNPSGTVARKIGQVGSRGIATSILSVAELDYGCAKCGSSRLLRHVETVLKAIDIVPFVKQNLRACLSWPTEVNPSMSSWGRAAEPGIHNR